MCFFNAIRRNYLSLAVLAAVGVPASAATVDYTTTASFTGCTNCAVTGNGTGNVTVVYGTGTNTATLVFTGTPAGTSVDSDAVYTTASYGTLTATYTGTGANLNGSFKLMIDQTVPNLSPTMGTLGTATLSGLVFDGKSTSYADFGTVQDPRISLGGPVVYELDTSGNINNPTHYGYTITSPSTGNPAGVTSLQGNIQATPEPTFLTLTGLGLLAMAGFAVMRKRAAVGA